MSTQMSPLAVSYVLDLSVRDEAARYAGMIDRAPISDTYFRPAYILGHEAVGQGKAQVFVLQTDRQTFVVPLLLRPLSQLSFTHDRAGDHVAGCEFAGYDAITPYGYGGVLKLSDGEPDAHDMTQFFAQLRSICRERRIVACLLRLHPLLAQDRWFQKTTIDGMTLHHHGPTTAIELSQWKQPSDAPMGLHKGRRSDLSHAEHHLSVSVASAASPQYLNAVAEFQQIYNLTMTRLAASSFYLFPADYYWDLAKGLDQDMCVVVARSEQTAVGAAIFFADREFAHYHLSGATELGQRRKATTLVIVEGARWARKRHCRWLHLGGGTHGGDSLFQFKNSFGGKSFSYSFVCFIADRSRYDALCGLRLAESSLLTPRAEFFPLYRG